MEAREQVIARWSKKILARLGEVLPAAPVEADFRRVLDPLLDEFCAEVGVNPLAHAEYTLATGRADAVFNRLVIEYERPGVLKRSPDAATRHAIQQVKDYLEGLAKKERHQMERLAGVVFDGHYLIFVRSINERWTEEPPVEVNTRPERGGKVTETGPFYSMFDVGDYTFAPWKVVWPNIASMLNAAVVGSSEGKVVVPQHIVTLVACETEEEAHYICALISSSSANFAARTYSQEGGKSFGDPHILEHIRIPRYNPKDAVHRRLAELSQAAHQAAVRATGGSPLHEIEAEIDRQAAQLWGLSQDELREIQAGLHELES